MSETRENGRSRRRAGRAAGPPGAKAAAGSAAETEASTESVAAITAVEPTTVTTPGSAERAETTAVPEAVQAAATHSAGNPPDGKPSNPEITAGAALRDADEKPADQDSPDPVVTENVAGAEAGTERADAEKIDMAKDTAAAAAADDTEKVETEKAGEAAAGPGRSWKRALATVAATVLVLALVAGAVLSVFAVRSTEDRDARRDAYLQTARQTILNLTTIRADTAKEDIDRILTMASGEFKTEFDGRVDPFTEIVKQAKVVSNGEVVEAAIERDDGNSATVLVAAKQTLTNAGQAEPQQRFYRFRVTVTKSDDGSLKSSDVEFVA
ncbi:hypothetical protein [Nocardia brevicatena]|uniref:hypothetical protein n=1 Tax=Nocardia brevicatena TaxID=37327 RepID=UPI000309ACCE|nr:hypothetical protein [Nocardia brevicatena]